MRGNGKIRTIAAVRPETTVMFPARSGFMVVDIVGMTVADGAIDAVGWTCTNNNEVAVSRSMRSRVETGQQGDEISGVNFCNRSFVSLLGLYRGNVDYRTLYVYSN